MPRTGTLEKLFGPFVQLAEIHPLKTGGRLFLFVANGNGFTSYAAFVVGSTGSKPHTNHLATVKWDMVAGGCGNHPRPIEVADQGHSYSIRDLNGDGVLDIPFELTEIVCATGQIRQRVMEYIYTKGIYKERSLTPRSSGRAESTVAPH